MAWTERDYKPCERDHMREFRTLDECGHDREHDSPEDHRFDEVQSDRDFRRLTRFEPGERARDDYRVNGMAELTREHRLRGARGDWDTRALPEPRRPVVTMRLVGHSGEMESQDGQGVRSTSRKLARAEMYSSQWHRRGGNTGGSNECDETELAKALAELSEN